MRRELAIAALRSSSLKDRQWGAEAETNLLDIAAWDALLAVAQDTDSFVRDWAREALRSIRAKETEMAEFRAMGEERVTRKRIEALIASDEPTSRRAGVAAIAATGLAGMVNDLIRLAAEDKDENVRDDARKALLAIAKPVAPISQPPAEKK
jgi:HEAT repeat protein